MAKIIPSMFGLFGNKVIKCVLIDFDLSIIVSVPTERRPISFGEILYLVSILVTTVMQIDIISSKG